MTPPAPVPAAHLAQLNVAALLHPLDDPRTAPFVDLLDPVNAAADTAPGFVWRLVEEGAADATGLRPAGEHVIVNLSVWQDQDSLWDFAYRSGHLEAMRQRRAWFARHVEAHLVLWWIPAGHLPTLDEALERLADLRAHGPSPARSPSPPPTPPPKPPTTCPPRRRHRRDRPRPPTRRKPDKAAPPARPCPPPHESDRGRTRPTRRRPPAPRPGRCAPPEGSAP